MTTPHRHLRFALSLAAVAVLLVAALPALASESPERGRATAASTDEAEAIQAPAGTFELAPLADQAWGPLLPRLVTPVEALDRGSLCTDAGLDRENVLNALERGKLEMARAAQNAVDSRMVILPEPVLPARPEDIEALKLERLRSQLPQAVSGPAGPDGVGDGLSSVQESGSQEPTAEELAKLQKTWPSDTNTNAPDHEKPEANEKPAQAEAQEVQR